MPPALPEEDLSESGSDGDVIPAKASTTGDDAVDDDEEEGEDEDEYVIEEIEAHVHDDTTGQVLYKVRWEGYPNEEDKTWEPEDNLASAKASLKAYWKSIGGKPKDVVPTKGSSKKRKANDTLKGRGNTKKGRSESVDPPAANKSTKKSRGSEIIKDEWKLPKGSWEDQVSSIDTIEEALDHQGNMQRFVYVIWENGRKTRHQLQTVNEKCPQKMLKYYESHLVFRSSDAETNGQAEA